MSSLSMSSFSQVDLSTADVEAAERLWGGLTDDVRRVLDLTIRSKVSPDAVARARELLGEAADLLGEDAEPGPVGVRYNTEGRSWNWGNSVVGVRNAMAPPVRLEFGEDDAVRSTLALGAPYEGPPGCVHGGVSALLLDHLMGEAASSMHERVTVTGTLTLRYEEPLPLGRIAMVGWISSEVGRKVTVTAKIGPALADGEEAAPSPEDHPAWDGARPAVTATGLFIIPAWAYGEASRARIGSLD